MALASLMRRPLAPGLLAAVVALMFAAPPATTRADAARSQTDQGASEYIGVARISALDGSVEVRQDGASAVAAAASYCWGAAGAGALVVPAPGPVAGLAV